ncbi:MAG: hypothetical protein ABSC50_06345 [Candidatus Bathyarchaeia archaeon]
MPKINVSGNDFTVPQHDLAMVLGAAPQDAAIHHAKFKVAALIGPR